jgi:Phage tail lysozyme/D-alanyl-D-alanine carboxypeptidase
VADGVVYTGFDPAFGDRLNRLIAAAKARGYSPSLISGVRSAYGWPGMKGQSQADLYNQLGKPGGPRAAAPPGSSPHQYGVAGDVTGIPQSVLEQMASQFGLRAIHSDPNHLELANWQKEAAAQPASTPWGNVPNIPSAFASNASASAPASSGGFAIPGTTITIGGGAPTPGALAETGPESSNAAGGAAQPGQPMDTRQLVFNRLTGAGLNPQQALGAMWSLGGESGGSLNTGAINPKDPGGSVGFGQWQGVRRIALENLAKTNGTSWTDPNTQADHLINELTNKDYSTYQPGVFDALKGAKTSEDAARIWTSQFERPTVDNSDVRIKRGAQVGSLDDSGNFVPGSAAASNTAVASNQPGGPRNDIAIPGTTAAANQAAADNQSLFGKFTQGPIDPATGKPDPNAKTPMAQIGEALLNNTKNTQAKVDAAGPEQTALSNMQAPMARNVSPMGGELLPSVPQNYMQRLASFARPLTYNAAPPQAPGMPAAGFQGGFGSQAPGISLNSLPVTFPGQIRPLTLDDYGYQGAGYAS